MAEAAPAEVAPADGSGQFRGLVPSIDPGAQSHHSSPCGDVAWRMASQAAATARQAPTRRGDGGSWPSPNRSPEGRCRHHRSARQVADRFHLMQNLRECIEQQLGRGRVIQVNAPPGPVRPARPAEPPPCGALCLPLSRSAVRGLAERRSRDGLGGSVHSSVPFRGSLNIAEAGIEMEDWVVTTGFPNIPKTTFGFPGLCN